MHGLGNDYVYINCFEQSIQNPEALAKKISDRHFGVGSDGLILILPSDIADCEMRMFNWDGSESEMCGNGIRCVAKFVFDKKIVPKQTLSIATKAGIKHISISLNEQNLAGLITVNMGNPIFDPISIPVLSDENPVLNLCIDALDLSFNFTCVSMGNPHAITFVDDLDNFDVCKYGPILENSPLFPRRANIEFVQVISKNHLKMRVWERGSGETFACGTGTCASVVATYLHNKCDRENVKVSLLGGDLFITWNPVDNNVYMSGPAEFVFEGELY